MPSRRRNTASLRLHLPDISKQLKAPFDFQYEMNQIGHHILRYTQLSTSALFLFFFPNTEALARALENPRIHNIVRKAGFSPIQREEARQDDSASTVYIKGVHANFFYDMVERQTNDTELSKRKLLQALKEDCNWITDVYIVPKRNKNSLPSAILVKLDTIDNAMKWKDMDTHLELGTLYQKDKSMQKRISLDICGVCRLRNCNKNGRRCDGIQRCSRCAYEGHNNTECIYEEYCRHCESTGHTSGSLKCIKNQKYSREKRTSWENSSDRSPNHQPRPTQPRQVPNDNHPNRPSDQRPRQQAPPQPAPRNVNPARSSTPRADSPSEHETIQEPPQQAPSEINPARSSAPLANSFSEPETIQEPQAPGENNNDRSSDPPTNTELEIVPEERPISMTQIRSMFVVAAVFCKSHNYNHEKFQSAMDRMYDENGFEPVLFPEFNNDFIDTIWPEKVTVNSTTESNHLPVVENYSQHW